MAARIARTRVRVKATGEYLPDFGQAGMSASGFEVGSGTPPPFHAGAGGYRAVGWWPSSYGPNAANMNLATIRARAAQEDRNSPLAGGAIDSIAANIVGSGVKPQSQCPDKTTRKAIKALFADWTDESDADNALDFFGQQWQVARTAANLGESFARFRIRRAGDMATVPLQIQLLEPDFVPLEWSMPLGSSGNVVQEGVETNGFGRKVAYWMYRQHPGDPNHALPDWNGTPVRVPASEVAQVFLPLRHGQRRGLPWLARALTGMRDDADYLDSERVRKKVASNLAGFIKVGEGSDGPVDVDAAGHTTWEPGTLSRLNKGEDIVWAAPSESGQTFEPFLKVSRRDLAVASGLLYEQLTGDWSQANDRTLRAALQEFRRKCEIWQHHMLVFQFCRAVWAKWMLLAEMTGQIERPAGMSDRDFYRVRWVPEPWPYYHPVQDRQARDMDVQGGYASRTAKTAELGEDAEVVEEEIAAENARADSQGLVFASDGRSKVKAKTSPAAASGAAAADDDEAPARERDDEDEDEDEREPADA